MRVAAIDIGTNTVRYLVSTVDGGEATDVARGREITRLGQGVDEARELHPEAVERTIDAVARFVDLCRDAGAERIRIAGTSALRDAANRDAFVQLVAERTDQQLDILSGSEEARLSMLGAKSRLPAGKPYAVVDIGGGSTEITSGGKHVSLDIGSVRIKERYLKSDPPTSEERSAARRAVGVELEVAADRLMISGYERLVGVAGTITTLAALVKGLDVYDRDVVQGTILRREQVMKWTDTLMSMTAAEIVALGPVEPGRADVIAGGALILKQIMLRFLFDEIEVSEHDILDGLVLALAPNR